MPASGLTFPPLPARESINAYSSNEEQMIRYVNEQLGSHSDLSDLIGGNPIEVMESNHKHHCQFMAIVFKLNLFDLLADTTPWVYRAYHSHGFSYDYFPVELKAWSEAVKTFLPADSAEEIRCIYTWMIDNHSHWISEAEKGSVTNHVIDPEYLSAQKTFLERLLVGDHSGCLKLARDLANKSGDLEKLYMMVIQPSMYDVGTLWEKGKISVAQEHLASTIVTRLFAEIGPSLEAEKRDRKVVITSAPCELHELGAWMISDFLEEDGWDVRYLGANTPQNDLMDFLKKERPQLLAISVTMAFHLEYVATFIEELREHPWLKWTKVIVGGGIFAHSPDMWKQLGADGGALSGPEAVELANQLCDDEAV